MPEINSIRIAIVGSKGVGKTSVKNQLFFNKDIQVEEADGLFHIDPKILQGLKKDFFITSLESSANAPVPEADAHVLVFNPCDKQSFLQLQNYVTQIRQNNPNSKLFLLCNEREDKNAQEVVTWDQIKKFLTNNEMSEDNYLHFVAAPAAKQRQQAQVALANIVAGTLQKLKSIASPQPTIQPTPKPIHEAKEASTQPTVAPTITLAKTPTATRVNPTFFMKVMSKRNLAIAGAVFLLAGIALLTAGTCGVGGAAVALGLTIGGAAGIGIGVTLFGASLYTHRKQLKQQKEEKLEKAFDEHGMNSTGSGLY